MAVIAEVRQLVARFTGALTEYDMEGLRALFARDADLLFYGTQANLHLRGWPALESAFMRQFDALAELRVSIDPDTLVALELAGGRAACVGSPSLRFQARAGDKVLDHRNIRVTAVAELRDEAWVFVQMHWSTAGQEVVVEQEGDGSTAAEA